MSPALAGKIFTTGPPRKPSLSFKCWVSTLEGFPGGSDGKESACNAGEPGLIPGIGRSPGGGNGNPL